MPAMRRYRGKPRGNPRPNPRVTRRSRAPQKRQRFSSRATLEGTVYGLVNNAGIGTARLLATMPHFDIEALVRLNTLSPVL